jgi:hypothetical protein
VLLSAGSVVGIGQVKIYVGRANRNAVEMRNASRRYLIRKAPMRLLCAEWLQLQRGTQIGICVCAILSLLLIRTFMQEQGMPTFDEVHELSAFITKKFPATWVRLDDASKTVVYGGYVQDKRELDQLRLYAWNSSADIPTMRVYVMNDVAAATRAFLERLYTEPRTKIDGPGRLTAEIQFTTPAKSLAAWDFEEVEKQAKNSIPGLERLRIRSIYPIMEPSMRVPLSQLGLNLVNAPYGRYLSGARGERYFAGAFVKDGTILDIARCSATFRPFGKDVVYQLIPTGDSDESCN